MNLYLHKWSFRNEHPSPVEFCVQVPTARTSGVSCVCTCPFFPRPTSAAVPNCSSLVYVCEWQANVHVCHPLTANRALCTSGRCLCSHMKLHLHKWSFECECKHPPLAQVELHAHVCVAHLSHKCSSTHACLPISPVAQFRTGCGSLVGTPALVGRGLGVGGPCLRPLRDEPHVFLSKLYNFKIYFPFCLPDFF